jgi:hypothetical protein
MKTKTLLKGTKNELKVTEIGNRIIIETLQDIEENEKKTKQLDCFIDFLYFAIAFGIGCYLTYLIFN